MKIGYIGLGKMGKNMVLRQMEQGNQVVVWNRSLEPREELRQEVHSLEKGANNLEIAETLDNLISKLEAPRTIWLMVTAGNATDEVLSQLADKLDKGDLIIDGGNSFFQETLRRNEILTKKGVHFMDVAVSGGIEGARDGACMMIGGDKEDFERALDVFKAGAAPDAFGHLGRAGAGHFAKMVHNGIEYGMMEAIAEGAAILKYSDFNLDLREVFRVYSQKSIIDSRLVSWTLAEFKEDPDLSNIASVIGSGGSAGKVKGEAHWTLEIAQKMGIDTPVIEASVAVRDNSDKDKADSPNGFRNKVVAAMRWQFGRHPVKKK